ncbi:hypothetical protein HDV01_002503 [Terramyces sp. JEL0728]|nr:hypothetical protein HDV01_002503 [Terramyces sp. JEL0728]
MSAFEKLPEDLFEFRILYYLDGIDIWKLSRQCKSLQSRLKPLCDFIEYSGLYPLQVWPTLYLAGGSIDEKLLKKLTVSSLIFENIIIDADTYYTVHTQLPKCHKLTLAINSYYQTFLHPSNIMGTTVDKISSLCLKGMDRGNIGFATDLSRLKEMRLQELEFSVCRDFIVSLATIIPSLSLSKLVLAHCAVGDTQLKLLMESVTCTKISYLECTNLNITKVGAASLAELLPHTNLISLVVRNCPVRKLGANVFAETIPYSRLEYLHLENNEFIQNDIFNLIQCLPDTKLKEFWCDAYTSVKEQELLARLLAQTHIKHVSICIEPKYLVGLLGTAKLTKLKVIGSNGDYICEALAECIDRLPRMLDLGFTEISIHGLQALLSHLKPSNLKELDLTGNTFKRDGLIILKDKLHLLGLKQISLGNTNFVTFEQLDDISLDMVAEFLQHLPLAETIIKFKQINFRDITVDKYNRKFVEYKGNAFLFSVDQHINCIERKGRSDGKCKYFDE